MIRKSLLLAALTVTSLVAGCSSDNNETHAPPPPPPAPPQIANVQVIHASADAPTVDVLANGSVLNGLTGVDYQVASGLFDVDAGTYTISVEANTPGGNAEVLSAELTLAADTNYNVFAVGSVAESTLELLPVVIAEDPVAAGNVQVQVVHAAANAPTVDVYVTAPDSDLAAEQPLDTLAFKDATGHVEVPAGDYQIRITPAGSMDVVFDSGSVPLPADADLIVAATTNVGTGASPVTLLVSDGTNVFNIWDSSASADVRVVHGISDAPAVDVIANNAVLLVDGLAFPDTTDYVSVMPGDYALDIVADADNSIVAADDIPVTLEQGVLYTAIANNELAAPQLDLLIDMPRSVATEAKVRIVHASPAAGAVDIYVTGTADISGASPAFSNVPYTTDALAETGYVALAEGDYVVTVTPTGTMDIAIQTPVLPLENGMVYTAIALDGAMEGDAPQLALLDDLAMFAPKDPVVRVVHASADAPVVDITAGGEILAGLENVDYQVASGLLTLDPGMYDVGVSASIDGMDVEVLQADLTLEQDMTYSVLAVGSVASGTLDLLPVVSEQTSVMAGNAQVQVVHAAAGAPVVDIHVSAPGATLGSSTLLAIAGFTDSTNPVQVPAGEYQIRLTPTGTTDVAFDSGPIMLTDGMDILVAATDNVGTGMSPVTLLILDGSGATKLWDVNTPADIRVVHAISDAPAVDVLTSDGGELVDGLGFPNFTDYLSVPADTYLLDVAADADNSIVAIDDASLTVETGMLYTAIANNSLAAADLDVLVDMPRSIATEAKVRIVHASPAAGDVDIYVTADGDIADVMPTFASVPYATGDIAQTGYVALPGGTYVVTVTVAGTKTVAIDTGELMLSNGGVYTAIARDGIGEGDGPGLILLDDFN